MSIVSSFRQNAHQNVAFLVTALLLVYLGVYLAKSMWLQISPAQSSIVPSEQLALIFKNTTVKSQSQPQIAPLHLFGSVQKQAVKVETVAPTLAPVSKLNLKLNGVFSSTPAENSLAIISTNQQDEQLYSIGENLPGGAILREVYSDRVIIERSGQLETLLLPKNDLKITDQTVSPSSELLNEQILHSTPKQLRTQILKDPSQLPKVMATVPYYKNGRIVGYKLKMKKYHGLLQQYGLQESDVITQVNGIALNNPANGFKILQQLTNASSLNVQILRNGQPDFVSVTMN